MQFWIEADERRGTLKSEYAFPFKMIFCRRVFGAVCVNVVLSGKATIVRRVGPRVMVKRERGH
jgi:hypothetical protein